LSHLLSVFKMIWIFFLAWTVFTDTSGESCVFDYNGKRYDFSTLNLPIASSDNQMSMGLCADNADTGNGACDPAMINQFYSTYHTGCNAYLAKWDNGAYTVGAVDAMGATDGIKLSFKNGQDCPGKGPRKTNINFLCSQQDASSFTWSEDTQCEYDITFQTTHACSSGPSPKNSSASGGLSGGWIFIIILLCLTFVYCVGGMAYNYKYDDSKQGMDLIPQRSMWTGIMEYTIVGCNISWTFVRSKYHEMCNKDRNYSIDDSEGPYTGRKFSSAGV